MEYTSSPAVSLSATVTMHSEDVRVVIKECVMVAALKATPYSALVPWFVFPTIAQFVHTE
jgi:hypothetical protein